MTYTNKKEASLWVFGYGSLIWNPGFTFAKSYKAYAVGFARRMYQGNTYHRGDETLPGRVATMIEQPSSTTNGIVFRVDGRNSIRKAIQHLKEREVDNGYEFIWIPARVLLDDGKVVHIQALTCIASKTNEFYLGPDEVAKMAFNICRAKGRAGPNVDYVLKLAEHVKLLFPSDHDEHLHQLVIHIRTMQLTVSAQ